jgi:hypothetical protein
MNDERIDHPCIHFGNVTIVCTFKVRIAWWVQPYLSSVWLFSQITGMEPDMSKVAKTVGRGLNTSVVEQTES